MSRRGYYTLLVAFWITLVIGTLLVINDAAPKCKPTVTNKEMVCRTK